MDLNILYRTSYKGINNPARMGGDKMEWSPRCFRSLLKSINSSPLALHIYNLKLTIIDDHSIPEWHDKLYKVALEENIKFDLVSIEGTGNGDSLKFNVEYAHNECKDLIFMCEDDYLFAPETIEQMLRVYSKVKSSGYEVVVHPADYPDRYYREMYPSHVILGDDRHWRTIKHTTCTIMFHHDVIAKHYEHFLGLQNFGKVLGWGEDQCLNKVYEDTMCISPLPSLATHFQHPMLLSPFFNWEKIYNDQAPVA